MRAGERKKGKGGEVEKYNTSALCVKVSLEQPDSYDHNNAVYQRASNLHQMPHDPPISKKKTHHTYSNTHT